MLVGFLDAEGFSNLGACSPFFAKRGHRGAFRGLRGELFWRRCWRHSTGFITCPDCNGDGFIYSDPENLMGASWGYPCATCGGNAEDVGYDDSEDIQKGSGKIPCPECSKKGNK